MRVHSSDGERIEFHFSERKLTDWPPANWAGSLLPGIFGLLTVGWDSFSEVDDKSSKLIRSEAWRMQTWRERKKKGETERLKKLPERKKKD